MSSIPDCSFFPSSPFSASIVGLLAALLTALPLQAQQLPPDAELPFAPPSVQANDNPAVPLDAFDATANERGVASTAFAASPPAPLAKLESTQGNLFTRAGAGLTGVSYGSTAIADLDGDNIPDLVVIGNASGTLTAKVYLGNGDGSFSEKTDAGLTGTGFGSMSVADLDNNGIPDLIITGQDASFDETTTVYLGNGDGSFSEKTDAGLIDVRFSSTAIADFDGDNIPDLVVTGRDASSNQIAAVYLGNGDGSFSEKTDAGLTGVDLGSSSIADLDGDDIPDLILTGSASYNNRVATVYLGNGDGSFSEKVDAGLTGVEFSSTSVADFNGDDIPDLAIAGWKAFESPSATVYLGNGDGSFTEKTDADLTGVWHSATSAADLDGDDTPDLVVIGLDESNTPTATVYLGNGDGSFTVADAGLVGTISGSNSGPISTADLDDDGDSDLVIAGQDNLRGVSQSSTRVYINRTEQTPPNRPPSWIRTPSSVTVAAGTPISTFAATNAGIVEAGDLDGDRLTLTLNGPPNASVVDAGNGVGQVDFAPNRNQAGQTLSPTLTVTDSDGALAVASFNVVVPDALAAFDADFTDIAYGTSAVADLNGDDIPDVVLTGQDASSNQTATVHLGNGDGSFTEKTDAGLTEVDLSSISVADFDDDDIPDLVITGRDTVRDGPTTPTARVYLGNGDGSFSEKAGTGLTEVVRGSTAVADLDGDDIPDLIVTGNNASFIPTATVYLGNGDGSFSEKSDTDLSEVDNGSIATSDLDGDDILDLVITGHDSLDNPIATVHLGNGDGSFSEKPDAGLTKVDFSSTSIADFDGDDIPDLVITGRDASNNPTTTVYIGNGDGSFSEKAGTDLPDAYYGSTSTADLDGDGIVDVVLTGNDASGNRIAAVYLGNGDGTFTAADTGLPGVDASSTSIADLDGDDRPDLLITGQDVSTNPITIAYQNLGGDPLPVELVQFDARRTGSEVTLDWATASETNNAGFHVEYQEPGAASFVEAGFVEGHGTTDEPQTYRFNLSDLEPGAHQFRLRQMDLNGTSTLSETVEVRVGLSETFSLSAPYPNPAAQSATLDLIVREAQPVQITLYNVLGQRVQTLYDGTVEAEQPLELTIDSHRLSGGVYFVRFEGEQFQATRRLTVVR